MSLEKTATVIQHLVDERNKPGFDLLCKVFEVYPNVSKDWLLEGREPMLTVETEAATAEVGAIAPAPAPLERVAPQPRPEPAAASAATPVAASAPATAAPAEPAPLVAAVAAPAPVAPTPVEALVPPVEAPTPPVAAPQPAPAAVAPSAPDTSWQTALYTQQMAHQLAMAEMRNQHLQDQQRMMQQMMDLMQRQLS
ncbi:hypothetical protein J7E24_07525 [Hymenobacter sp. ISL-91]|uniref:hypothetical protein n=1 Tax=Hymenobacter sp. ISL-91 TaxID=2819151 RepID=UPI001BE63796|nr:hypothetical protein [Hymenobacter sp. ISL-91]MBT2557629.1 hypothetical protein [Hymenobacter sp. ISL-91]